VPPTPAYEFDQRIGDVNAFALVQQHFEQLHAAACITAVLLEA